VLRRAVRAAFDPCTQQQLKMLQRRPDLGMGLVEAAFPLRTGHVDGDATRNFELLGHRVRSCLALEAKLNEDARSRHAREAHGAPQPRERERGQRPSPPVTAEDQESVIGPEPVVRDAGEKFLRRYAGAVAGSVCRGSLPAVVVASVYRDVGIEKDMSVSWSLCRGSRMDWAWGGPPQGGACSALTPALSAQTGRRGDRSCDARAGAIYRFASQRLATRQAIVKAGLKTLPTS